MARDKPAAYYFERFIKRLSKAKLSALRNDVLNNFDLTIVRVMEKHKGSTSHCKLVCEHFGIDPAARGTAVYKAKHLRLLLEKVDLEAFRADVAAARLTLVELRNKYGVNYSQFYRLFELIGANRDEYVERTKAKPTKYKELNPEEKQWWMERTLSKDGMSLEWLSKKW